MGRHRRPLLLGDGFRLLPSSAIAAVLRVALAGETCRTFSTDTALKAVEFGLNLGVRPRRGLRLRRHRRVLPGEPDVVPVAPLLVRGTARSCAIEG